MKRSMWIVIVLLMAVSSARAANRPRVRGEGFDKMRERIKEQQAANAWQSFVYQLPGSYALLDRVQLTDDQKKILGEIYLEWRKKWNTARDEAMKDVPKLERKDFKDAEKRDAYYAARRKAAQSTRPPLPMDAVRGVLTMDQSDALDSADNTVKDWQTGLKTTMEESEKKLNELLGAVDAKVSRSDRYALWGLRSHVEGAEFLPRLNLTAQQKAALKGASITRVRAFSVPAQARAALVKVTASHHAVGSALWAGSTERRGDEIRTKVNEILTAEQRKTLAAAVAIVTARDQAIAERYEAFHAKLDKALPPPERRPAAGAPPEPVDPLKDHPDAKQIIASFEAWLDETLPNYDKQLEEALGPEPEAKDGMAMYRAKSLEKHLKGASLLPRLELTDEQREQIDSLKTTRAFGLGADERMVFSRLSIVAKLARDHTSAIEKAIRVYRTAKNDEHISSQLEAILTADQRAKLAKAADILAARDKAVRERYAAAVKALKKAVPPAEKPTMELRRTQ